MSGRYQVSKCAIALLAGPEHKPTILSPYGISMHPGSADIDARLAFHIARRLIPIVLTNSLTIQ